MSALSTKKTRLPRFSFLRVWANLVFGPSFLGGILGAGPGGESFIPSSFPYSPG